MIAMRPDTRVAVAALVVCAMSLGSCADTQQARARAEAATARFHQQFNGGQFDAIYANADPGFLEVSGAQPKRSLPAYRSQLGSFQRVAKPVAWKLDWNSEGAFVTVTTDSTFDRGAAYETFVWRVGRTASTLRRYTLREVRIAPADGAGCAATASTPARRAHFISIRASRQHLDYLCHYYREHLGLDIDVLAELTVDDAAWSPERRQWSAEGLAEQVRQSVTDDGAVVIGITGEDIYRRRANWQFAFSVREGRIAIVSYARMDPGFFGQPESGVVTQRRLRRMVTKNLGLMVFGLEASPHPASPLYQDIGGIEELDAMGDDLALAGFPVVAR